VVVLRGQSTATAEELIGFCKERLSPYKVPKSVEFRGSLPHTEIGKVNKVRLREMIVAEMSVPI
jgi:acyl-CoA synthetase (AMP-forming)/AMP-acid ligase II